MDVSDTIDARGLLCPLPVLKLRKRLNTVEDGALVELWADDPAAAIDVPHFCTESGHELIGTDAHAAYVTYRVRKKVR